MFLLYAIWCVFTVIQQNANVVGSREGSFGTRNGVRCMTWLYDLLFVVVFMTFMELQNALAHGIGQVCPLTTAPTH